MPRDIHTNRNDRERANALHDKDYQQSGGLSESMIPTPEESRKAALLRKVYEEGY